MSKVSIIIKGLFVILLLSVSGFAQWDGGPWDEQLIRWGNEVWGDSIEGGEINPALIWNYKVPLIVDNSTNSDTLFDHVVWFKLSSTDSIFSHSADGADFRAQNEHEQSLWHWLRSDLSWGDTGWVAVKCDTVLPSVVDTIGYGLYGNTYVSSTSNGDSTFIVFQGWDTPIVVCGQSSPALFDSFMEYTSNPILNRADEIREFSNLIVVGDTMYLWCPAYTAPYSGDRDTMITHLAKSANGTTWVWVDSVMGTETDSNWIEDAFIITNGCELSETKNTWYMSGDTVFAFAENKGGKDDDLYTLGIYYSLDTFKTIIPHPANPILEKEGDESLVASPICWWSADSNKFFLFYEGSVTGVHAGVDLATSPTLYGPWTRNPNNPVLELGDNGTWDDYSIVCHGAWWDNGTFYLWYHGHDEAQTHFGFATSTDFETWTKDAGNPYYDIGAGVNVVYTNEKYLAIFTDGSYDVELGYFWRFDTTGWRAAYPDWDIEMRGLPYSTAYVEDGILTIAGEQSDISNVGLISDDTVSVNGISFEIRLRTTDWVNEGYCYSWIGFGKDSLTEIGNWTEAALDSGYGLQYRKGTQVRLKKYDAGATVIQDNIDVGDAVIKAWNIHELAYSEDDSLYVKVAGIEEHVEKDVTFSSTEKHIGFSQGNYNADWGGTSQYNWLFVRKFSYPQPVGSVGGEEDNP